MKKIIAVLLALVMMFTMTTVAFAAEGDATEPPAASDGAEGGANDGAEDTDAKEEEPLLGELDWLLDLPIWTLKPAFKVAKIALKLVKVVVKLGMIFGIIDSDEIIGKITDLINSAQKEDTAPETDGTVDPAPEASAPAA